jgi:hypothetical protein
MYLLVIVMIVSIASQETENFNQLFGWHSPATLTELNREISSSVAVACCKRAQNYFNRCYF